MICCLVVLGAACHVDENVIATCDGEAITVADLDAFLLTLPEGARRMQEGQSHEQFVEAVLGRMAVEKALLASDTAREMEGSSKIEAMRTAGKVSLLVERLMQQFAAAYEPDPEKLATITEQLSKRAEDGTIYTFEHIFLRLDRASSPAELRAIRSKAAQVRAEAQAGADFAELARLHSQSADAGRGGIVADVTLDALDDTTAGVLATLNEGEVSRVVESRTGLHIFKLKRRLVVEGPEAGKIDLMARQLASRQGLAAERAALLDRLREEVPVDTDSMPWHVGSWTLDEETVELLSAGSGNNEQAQSALLDQLLLAEEALTRGLWTPEMERALDRRVQATIFEAAFRKERAAYSETLLEDRLRPFYEAQPSAYVTPEMADIDLIFVPEGLDSYETLRQVEDYVAALRAGASFADLAREISKGPAAEEGGAVGSVPRDQWGRWGQAIGEAIRNLEPGQISDPIYCTDKVLTYSPVILKGGFAIVRVNTITPEQPRTFEEAVEAVRIAFTAKNREEIDEEVRKRLQERVGFKILRIPAAEEFGQ